MTFSPLCRILGAGTSFLLDGLGYRSELMRTIYIIRILMSGLRTLVSARLDTRRGVQYDCRFEATGDRMGGASGSHVAAYWVLTPQTLSLSLQRSSPEEHVRASKTVCYPICALPLPFSSTNHRVGFCSESTRMNGQSPAAARLSCRRSFEHARRSHKWREAASYLRIVDCDTR